MYKKKWMSAVTNRSSCVTGWCSWEGALGAAGSSRTPHALQTRWHWETEGSSSAGQLCTGAECSPLPTSYAEQKMSSPSMSFCTDENAVLQSTELWIFQRINPLVCFNIWKEKATTAAHVRSHFWPPGKAAARRAEHGALLPETKELPWFVCTREQRASTYRQIESSLCTARSWGVWAELPSAAVSFMTASSSEIRKLYF